MLGNSIALYNPPVRVAEEFAMLDCISGGRLVAGFPVGTSMDTNYCYGQIPSLTREKYQEAHDLIIKAWTDARAVRLQRPLHQAALRQHLAAADPAAASADPHSGRRLGRDLRLLHRQHLFVFLPQSFSGYIRAQALMKGYWDRVAERDAPDTSPYRAGFAQTICVAESDEEAERLYSEHVALLLQPLPARLCGLRRRAGLSHHQDHPDRRAVAIRAAARAATPS